MNRRIEEDKQRNSNSTREEPLYDNTSSIVDRVNRLSIVFQTIGRNGEKASLQNKESICSTIFPGTPNVLVGLWNGGVQTQLCADIDNHIATTCSKENIEVLLITS